MSGFDVALENMGDDIAKWSSAGSALGTIANSAASLTITPFAFTGRGAEVAVAYEEVRAHVEQLARDGEAEVNAAVDTLGVIRDAYQDDEAAAAQRYAGMWTFEG